MVNPRLERMTSRGVTFWTDRAVLESGIRIAFSERLGGVSCAPYESLDLAHHVGDAPGDVDENRDRFLAALDLGPARSRLVTAEQVHGDAIVAVNAADAGRGASARSAKPVAATDALVTSARQLPLMLLFADCVPVIIAAPGYGVGVVHAGWRGALARIPQKAVARLCSTTGCVPADVVAYVGAHICGDCYEVSDEILSQFANTFDTLSRASGRHLDLSLAVTESLVDAGVETCRIARLGVCTAQATDRFYSYRAEAGLTGRHAALACVL